MELTEIKILISNLERKFIILKNTFEDHLRDHNHKKDPQFIELKKDIKNIKNKINES